MRTPEVSHPSPTTAEDFRRVLDERAIQPLFQPLIDLETRHVVGYEALARGPMGSALESPAALFGAAWRAGRVAELDWACRAAAFTGAAEAGLARRSPRSSTPSRCRSGRAAPTTSGPPSSWAAGACGWSSRSPSGPWPATRPGCWPPSPRPAKPAGGWPWTTSATPRPAWPSCRSSAPTPSSWTCGCSRAAPPPRRPTSSTPSGPTPSGPTPWSSPRASRPSSTPARPWPPGRRSARGSCSATRPRCPRPCPRPARPSRCDRRPPRSARPPPGSWWRPAASRAGPPGTCWSRCACSSSTRGWTRPSPTSCWPASRTTATSPRPPAAATSSWPPGPRSPGCSATACRSPRWPGPRADLAADDPLRREWDLVVIGPRFAAALVARDRNDHGPDARRGFDVIVTHDRDLVIRAAEPLLRRLVPTP